MRITRASRFSSAIVLTTHAAIFILSHARRGMPQLSQSHLLVTCVEDSPLPAERDERLKYTYIALDTGSFSRGARIGRYERTREEKDGKNSRIENSAGALSKLRSISADRETKLFS